MCLSHSDYACIRLVWWCLSCPTEDCNRRSLRVHRSLFSMPRALRYSTLTPSSNISLLVLALKVLGWRFLLKTIYATAALYFLLEYAQELMPKIEGTDQFVQILGPGNNFMSLLIGCTLTGSSLAIVFLNNGSTGGTDIIAAVVNKFFNLSLGQVLFLVDIFIIGSCFFFPQFGTYYERARMMVFGLCTMIVENFMLDYVMNARRESVQFLIFSRKYQEIANAIALHTDHGVTILDGHGWYTGKENESALRAG